jgi:hypothetical protein
MCSWDRLQVEDQEHLNTLAARIRKNPADGRALFEAIDLYARLYRAGEF